MSQSARTKRWQRILDSLVGAVIVYLGINRFGYFTHHPHWPAYGYVWSVLLIGTGIAVIVGAALRTIRPGHRQSTGFQFELGGWGGSACLLFWYGVVSFSHNRDAALLGLFTLAVLMLAGAFFRLVGAMREGIRHVKGGSR